MPARLMLVGEQPGDREDVEGRPFIGRAGLEKPTKANPTACLPWVQRELELVQPEVLVALGATAVEGLLGKAVSVMRDRGRPIESDLAPAVLVTIHPSAVLRARDDRDAMFDGLVRDLGVAARALDAAA